MQAYETLVEALNALKKQGYTNDFNMTDSGLECTTLKMMLKPEEFDVVETYRWEGESDPEDNTILYVIESKSGIKGTLVNAYGVYADPIPDKLVEKLNIIR